MQAFISWSPVLFLIHFCLLAQGQPYVDVFQIQFLQFAPSEYQEESEAELKSYQTTAELFLPVELRNKNFLIAGLAYSQAHLESPYLPVDQSGNLKLRSVTLQLGALKQWNETWSSTIVLMPRISSDKRDWTRDDYQLGGAVLVTKQHLDHLALKLGLYYNREHFGNYFMPLLGVDWRANDWLNIFGVLPGSMNVEYHLADNLYTGLAWRDITASYRLEGGDYIREGHKFWGHIRLSTFLSWYFASDLALTLDVGHTAARRYQRYEENSKILTEHQFNQLFRNGLFIGIGVAYRKRLD